MARFLAIDWDQNQLHIISAEVSKGTVRVKRAKFWQESRVPNPALAVELGNFLKEKLKEANIPPAPVLACVGRDRLIVKDIRYPLVPDIEEPAVVRFQTVKELTDAAEDVIIDYVRSGPPVGGEQKASALVVRKEFVEAYKTICETAGVKLLAVVPRSIGVAACLRKVMGTTIITPYPNPRDGVIAVLNMGEKFAEICILQGDAFLLTRSLNNGPNLASEIRRNLIVHAGQMPHLPVVAVYLTGTGAGELRQRLSDMIEQPVYTFDPFAWDESIDFSEGQPKQETQEVKPATMNLLQETGVPRPSVPTRGTYSGAMGLLFLKAAGNELPVNFVSPRQPKPPVNPNYRLIRLAAVAILVLFVGIIVLGQVLTAMNRTELELRQAELKAVEDKLLQDRAYTKRLKDIDSWDTVVWLDELYDLNARIPDVNKLRITSIKGEPYQLQTKEKNKTTIEKTMGKITIKGKLLDRRNPREPLDQLIEELRLDPNYIVVNPEVTNDTFVFTLLIDRKGPDAFKQLVKVEKAVVAEAEKEAKKEKPKTTEAEDENWEEEFDPSKFGKNTKEKQAAIEALKNKLEKGGNAIRGAGDDMGRGKGKMKGKGKGKGRQNDN